MIAPSKQAFVPFLSVANMMRLVHAIGVEQVMVDLAAEIEADALDISARHAVLYNRLGMPSFVATLAGLLALTMFLSLKIPPCFPP